MPAPTKPQQTDSPITRNDFDKTNIERDTPGQTASQIPGKTAGEAATSRPNQGYPGSTKSGRPQDDRDPNSPPRSTQRPGEPMNADTGDIKVDREGIDRMANESKAVTPADTSSE